MSETPKVELLRADELALLRERHSPSEQVIEFNNFDGSGWKPALAWVCDTECEDLWPCDIARLLATLDAVLKAARREHDKCCAAISKRAWILCSRCKRYDCDQVKRQCDCGADDHNARLDALVW